MGAEIGIDVLRIEFGISRSIDTPIRVVTNDPGFGSRCAAWQLGQADNGGKKEEYPRGTRSPKL